MTGVLICLGGGVLVAVICAQCTFLAPTLFGAIFYFPNIAIDALWKRLGGDRLMYEIAAFALGLVGLLASRSCTLFGALSTSLVFTLLKLYVWRAEYAVLTDVYLSKDSRRRKCGTQQGQSVAAGFLPAPTVHPELVINVNGPFVRRCPRYDLGDIMLGREFDVEVLIANHSVAPCQASIHVVVECEPCLSLLNEFSSHLTPLAVGSLHSVRCQFRAVATGRSGSIRFRVLHGDAVDEIRLWYRSISSPDGVPVAKARILRYPGARSSAFAWRGDMDLYDAVTFQSIDGLTHTFSLAARYRFPQTMYLSTRLSLDAKEAAQFYSHFGVVRGQQDVDAFRRWMGEHVELRHDIRYPCATQKAYALELGNHMHLHYGTDAAAAPENGWKLGAGIGSGRYGWNFDGEGSFAEQRDNALMAKSLMEQAWGFSPKSWAMPDSTNDEHTPAAVGAAGCEVTSDANARHVDNVIFQPAPHHPDGTTVVELTKRYPGDPQDYVHYAMNLYWIHRAQRRGIPVIFMCHQHLRMYEGHACTRFTEAVMRYVLKAFNGDLHVNTVYGIGKYWREVLSPVTRTVKVRVSGGRIEVENTGDAELNDVPVDIQYRDGRTTTVMVDLASHSTTVVEAWGRAIKGQGVRD